MKDDLTLNANADPLAGGLALLQKKFLPLGLELNKDKSTIWTNPNGLSHNSNLVERTRMKRADTHHLPPQLKPRRRHQQHRHHCHSATGL